MRVAVFGGTGFLGYDFVRTALRQRDPELIVYSSGQGNLANVCRHGVEVRPYCVGDPSDDVLDESIDVVVNFAHPFVERGAATGRHQLERFVRVVENGRRRNPALRLIHVSSIAVFEPFQQGHYFSDADTVKPPRTDRYAQEKVFAEAALRALPDADEWQMHLRPTIVYGPFCRPFTDRFFTAFRAGNVPYWDLSGKVQPIYGEDISLFICDRLNDFAPGVYSLPGPEAIEWRTFVETFSSIVDHGRLVRASAAPSSERAAGRLGALSNRVWARLRREPALQRISRSLFRRASGSSTEASETAATSSASPRADNETLLWRSYFSEDRLVDGEKVRRQFPTFRARPLSDTEPTLRDYYNFRFSDQRFV